MSSCPLQAVVDMRHLEVQGAAGNNSGGSTSLHKYLGLKHWEAACVIAETRTPQPCVQRLGLQAIS